jgi:hypothetical protein
MYFEEDDDSEDYFERQSRLWQEDELTRYINSFHRKLTEDERTNLQLDIIDKYFPGIKNLSDDELVRQKYCPSFHHFQYLISIKRMFEITGRGSAIPDSHSWTFVFAGEGI